MELIQFSTEMWTSVKEKGTKKFLLRYETRFYYDSQTEIESAVRDE
jgi:hypothetical protein